MGNKIVSLEVRDIRFPTSRQLDGSDAMNSAPDYSAAYVTMRLADGREGYGLTFTIGRGTEIVVRAIESLRPLVIGVDFDSARDDMGGFWRKLTGDSQLRWIGPDKGVIHLATAAIVNAAWDLWGRIEEKPVWRLLSDMSPEQLVRCLDFRFVTDVLRREEALEILRTAAPTKGQRIAELTDRGYPAYTTAVGWLGYSEEKIRRLAREALKAGFTAFKQKVGASTADDIRRGEIIRDVIGPDRVLMLDANQVWDVEQAISTMSELKALDPYWIEEPTSPDDVMGHARIREAIKPVRVATGEHCQNRVIFKQLLAAGAIDVCQIDVARLGGVNEAVLVMLMASKFGIPVCPHGGGVGLCEYIQHLSMFDFVAVSGSMDERYIEHVAHLHEHFHDPIVVRNGRYAAPAKPGFSIEIRAESLEHHQFPEGPAWRVA